MPPPGTSGIEHLDFTAQNGELPGVGMPTPYISFVLFGIV